MDTPSIITIRNNEHLLFPIHPSSLEPTCYTGNNDTSALNDLLKKSRNWNWTKECTQAVQLAKSALTSSPVLTHYNPALPLKLAADASAYGVGAVISHTLPDSSEHPVAYASRTLCC